MSKQYDIAIINLVVLVNDERGTLSKEHVRRLSRESESKQQEMAALLEDGYEIISSNSVSVNSIAAASYVLRKPRK